MLQTKSPIPSHKRKRGSGTIAVLEFKIHLSRAFGGDSQSVLTVTPRQQTLPARPAQLTVTLA
jgi:hypothetical protein